MDGSPLSRQQSSKFSITALRVGAVLVVIIAAVFVEERLQRKADGPFVNDTVQFWCASHLIREGRSPYDVEGQAELSNEAGWNANRHGAGRYRFMPFYYPLWAGLAGVPLSWLSFSFFVAAWSVLQYAAVIAAASILCRIPERFPRILGFLLIAVFPLSTQVAEMGQVANLFLLGTAVIWWCGERDRDVSAGLVLSLLCSKPQLAVLLVPCVLLWAIRQKRFRIVSGFIGGFAALLAVSFLVQPTWLIECIRAPLETPMVTGDEPWKLTTWNALLQTAGVNGIGIGILFALLAIPMAVWSIRTAWNDESDLKSVASLSLLSVWFVSPYARSYDMVVLLFPLMVLLGRIAVAPRAVVLLFAALLPHYHQFIRWQRAEYPVAGLEIWWSWMPVVLSLLWLAADRGALTAWNPHEIDELRSMAVDSATRSQTQS